MLGRLLMLRTTSSTQTPVLKMKTEEEVPSHSGDNAVATTDLSTGQTAPYVPRKYEATPGLWKFRPKWLFHFATIRYYVMVRGVFGISLFMFSTYFIATITTIEKRFKIPSRTTGLIASCLDVGGITAIMGLAYFGSHGFKTRWLATGGLIVALSAYLRFSPQLIFGSGRDALQYDTSKNLTKEDPLCAAELNIEENCSLESDALVTVIILGLAQICQGVGAAAFHTLGIAYLDDNSKRNKVPIYLAVATAVSMIGPTLGYFFASYCLSIYVEPSVQPPFDRDDARWVGAWWLGWIPLGTFHILLSFLMALFPWTLPNELERRKEDPTRLPQVSTKPSLKDFWAIINRLARNKIFMFNTFSAVFYFFGMEAYWIFTPKYIETVFRKSASVASLVTGAVGLSCMALGVLVSGAVVSIFKPRPSYLAWWNVFTESLDVMGHVAFAFITCVKDDLHGVPQIDGSWNLTVGCNADCHCSPSIKYNPVCSMDGSTTFYSPCHAGCSSFEIVDSKKTYFNCTCVPDSFKAIEGSCPSSCETEFMWFLILLCGMQFLAATGKAGNAIIQFRSVAPKDKAVSIALAEGLVSVVAFIPAPILFGSILDATCLVWGQTCGVTGNCWLYHGQSFRYLLNLSASSLILIGTLFDVGVALSVKDLKIYDEQFENKDKNDGDKINPLLLMAT